jgi:predicted HicB family RNase H-like nuclease
VPSLELDEQVDVAVRREVLAKHRAEEGQPANVTALEAWCHSWRGAQDEGIEPPRDGAGDRQVPAGEDAMKVRDVAEKYAYRVVWSEEDREYVGLCAEMPSLSWLEKSQEAALRGIVGAAAEAVRDMTRARELPPAPLATRRYSGQFKVRIPPRVHRQLALEAAEEKVSLNRLVAAKLTHG